MRVWSDVQRNCRCFTQRFGVVILPLTMGLGEAVVKYSLSLSICCLLTCTLLSFSVSPLLHSLLCYCLLRGFTLDVVLVGVSVEALRSLYTMFYVNCVKVFCRLEIGSHHHVVVRCFF